jgi:hypothetical protein
MDQKLFEHIEQNVSDRKGSYSGLSSEALLTSDEDFRAIFQAVNIESWCELGSGHGLGTLIFSDIFPDKKSFGVEFEKSRLDFSLAQAQQKNSSAQFIHADLLSCNIPEVQTYFFYFPTGPVLDRILFELGKRTDDLQLIVIESHGDFLERLKLESWLVPIQEIELVSCRHYQQAVVFKKVSMKKDSIFDYSFQEKCLLIQDERGQWLADTWELEFLKENLLQLKYPPRTISQAQVIKILNQQDIPEKLKPFVHQRRSDGCWRKLYLYPEMLAETPEGSFIKLVEDFQV